MQCVLRWRKTAVLATWYAVADHPARWPEKPYGIWGWQVSRATRALDAQGREVPELSSRATPTTHRSQAVASEYIESGILKIVLGV